MTSFLSETFESGTGSWIANPGTWTATVVASTAAIGTRSLELTGGSYFAGPYYLFNNGVKPSHIGLWMIGVGGVFVVSSGTTANNNLIRIGGATNDGSTYSVATGDLAWHHVELRNINWSARTFDIYFDATLATSMTFPTSFGTSVGRIDIFNLGTTVTHWDEIDVSP